MPTNSWKKVRAAVGGAALLTASPVAAAALPGSAASAQSQHAASTAGSCQTTFTSPTPVVGVANPKAAAGYWEVDQAGQVAAIGGATCYGSLSGSHLNSPIVGMAASPDGGGYWLVASDGGVFAFGDAAFYSSAASMHLNQPIVGMAATPDGHGYWLVAADGGVFSFGDAAFYGSTGGMRLNQNVVGIAPTSDGHGYWLVARDGGIFSFGDAGFHGSTGAMHLNSPVVAMAPDTATGGYWLVAGDGGVFSFDAPYLGSAGGQAIGAPVTAITATYGSAGYRIVGADGHVYNYGDATDSGQATLPPGTELRCLSSQITAAMVGGRGGVGNLAAAIGLTNTSKVSCIMDGYPGVAMLIPANGDATLPVTTVRGRDYLFGDPGPSSINLAPGQQAYFDLGYTDVAQNTPASDRIEYIVPNGTNPVFMDLSGTIRAYPGPAHINVNAVHPAPAFSA